MADRLLVPYKSSYLRIFETLVVLTLTFGLAEMARRLFPNLPVSYVIIAGLVIGYSLVPRLGDRWAIRRGAPMMPRSERTRRYLSELGPIGSPDTATSLLLTTQQVRLRRTGSRPRSRRRG